ncbi:MAG: MFS transporter [Chloroflexi bacterium]|nr:MFS transporter [Chloroflexota bacterium]MCI0862982.1 MFS transporter [Chloroflexota bacterium]MCI0899526.1 MFS transporter [Chloroflexota bacterium]
MPGIIANYKEVLNTPARRQVLTAITGGQLLVQLSSLPVTLALPTMARSFGTSLEEAAWIVILNLLVLGSTVLLGARLGDKFGHPKVFFIGAIIITVAAVLIASSQTLMWVVVFRGVQGLGAGLIHGNGNAMLAFAFPPEERGRAYAFPISGSRMGTLIGIAVFGIFLEFFSWRLVFLTMLPIGLIVMWTSMPVLRRNAEALPEMPIKIDFIGAGLLIATAAVFLLGGMHVHGGDETFTSAEALRYHLPMNVLFVVLLGVFILVERRISQPFVDFRHFRHKYFTLSLVSNVMFHVSMLATMVLLPIMIEDGLGRSPIFVVAILVPHQSFGIWLPAIAGIIHDRYNPKLLRTFCMLSIAVGFVLLAVFAAKVNFWLLPLLLLPISFGTNIFNTVNNATVMSTLPTQHRGFASGMLETTRDLGHAVGATFSSIVMAMVLPGGIALMVAKESQHFYMKGFQTAALAVVAIMITGAVIAAFHRTYDPAKDRSQEQPSPAAADD